LERPQGKPYVNQFRSEKYLHECPTVEGSLKTLISGAINNDWFTAWINQENQLVVKINGKEVSKDIEEDVLDLWHYFGYYYFILRKDKISVYYLSMDNYSIIELRETLLCSSKDPLISCIDYVRSNNIGLLCSAKHNDFENINWLQFSDFRTSGNDLFANHEYGFTVGTNFNVDSPLSFYPVGNYVGNEFLEAETIQNMKFHLEIFFEVHWWKKESVICFDMPELDEYIGLFQVKYKFGNSGEIPISPKKVLKGWFIFEELESTSVHKLAIKPTRCKISSWKIIPTMQSLQRSDILMFPARTPLLSTITSRTVDNWFYLGHNHHGDIVFTEDITNRSDIIKDRRFLQKYRFDGGIQGIPTKEKGKKMEIVVSLIQKIVEQFTVRGQKLMDLLEFLYRGTGDIVQVAIVGGAIRDCIRHIEKEIKKEKYFLSCKIDYAKLAKESGINDIDLAVACDYNTLKRNIGDFFSSRGKPLNDSSFRTSGAASKFGMMKIMKISKDKDDLDIGVFKSFSIAALKEMDFNISKIEDKDYAYLYGYSFLIDSLSRDYSINAIYINPVSGEVFDPLNALSKDLWIDPNNQLVSIPIALNSSETNCTPPQLEFLKEYAEKSFTLDYGGHFRYFKELKKLEETDRPADDNETLKAVNDKLEELSEKLLEDSRWRKELRDFVGKIQNSQWECFKFLEESVEDVALDNVSKKLTKDELKKFKKLKDEAGRKRFTNPSKWWNKLFRKAFGTVHTELDVKGKIEWYKNNLMSEKFLLNLEELAFLNWGDKSADTFTQIEIVNLDSIAGRSVIIILNTLIKLRNERAQN